MIIDELRVIGSPQTNIVMGAEVIRIAQRVLKRRPPEPRKEGVGQLVYPYDAELAEALICYARVPTRIVWDCYRSDARRLEPLYDELLADVRAVFETNVFGVIAVTQAFLPLLRESPAGRIVNVSSGVGSITRMSDSSNPYRTVGGVSYSPSKSALNAVTVAFANELAGTAIKVNAACPGYTATDFNGHSGPRTVEQGAREPVRLALLPADGPTGTFSNEDGPLPW